MRNDAKRQLLRAAEKGDAGAQFNLGVLYDNRLDDNGHAIGGNRAEAIKWLLCAAQQNLARAQSKLAEVYADGPDAPENNIRASAWFLLAMTNLSGIHRQMAQSGYERVSSHMTPAQIAKARCLAQLWKQRMQERCDGGIAGDVLAEGA